MSFRRAGMLGLALLGVVQVADTAAQTTPVMGYVAAKNANPKRLEVFKQGLTELGYVEGRISVLNTEKPSWMRNITASSANWSI
jgi:hypothetical protein